MLMTHEGNRSAWIAVAVAALACMVAYASWRISPLRPIDTSDSPPARPTHTDNPRPTLTDS
ncbi:hypothetical protein VT03_01355 [Planctomyces sp. SH-PL14]|jgi:hypothetical protein|nr:hypothetical protein VT03_01355 [Planctomyces sp. SH-PL14]